MSEKTDYLTSGLDFQLSRGLSPKDAWDQVLREYTCVFHPHDDGDPTAKVTLDQLGDTPSPMKRYLLFSGEDYYPRGGWCDCQGSFDTILECMGAWTDGDWFHIVDTEIGEICKRGELE